MPMCCRPRHNATIPRKLVAPPPTAAFTSAGMRKTKSSVAAPLRNCMKPALSPPAVCSSSTPMVWTPGQIPQDTRHRSKNQQKGDELDPHKHEQPEKHSHEAVQERQSEQGESTSQVSGR